VHVSNCCPECEHWSLPERIVILEGSWALVFLMVISVLLLCSFVFYWLLASILPQYLSRSFLHRHFILSVQIRTVAPTFPAFIGTQSQSSEGQFLRPQIKFLWKFLIVN
jgi:hypothetical protein